MHDTTPIPAPLLGTPLNVIVLGPPTFAETLEAQHTPVILVVSQYSGKSDRVTGSFALDSAP